MSYYKNKKYSIEELERIQAWQDSNAEKVKQYKKNWRNKNTSYHKEYSKQHRKEHPEYYKRKVHDWQKNYPNKNKAKAAKYRAKKLQATPTWADLEAINTFYDTCPPKYHVDHIIPLQGKNVCGLHVVENLQYLSANVNFAKGNRYES